MTNWYVICSKHRKEDLVWTQLCIRNIEVYYPYIRVQSTNPHRRKIKPYFPGYLFIHVDMDIVGSSTLQWIPGVIGLVCFGGEPAYISDRLLQTIRRRIDHINTAGNEESKNLKTGDDITIHSGPFAGYHGIFNSYLSDRERASILLKFIRDQQTRVVLPTGQISLTKQRRT